MPPVMAHAVRRIVLAPHPPPCKPIETTVSVDAARALAGELQGHLDAYGQNMPTQAYLTLSNFALRLHQELPGIVTDAVEHATGRAVSEDSWEADMRMQGWRVIRPTIELPRRPNPTRVAAQPQQRAVR